MTAFPVLDRAAASDRRATLPAAYIAAAGAALPGPPLDNGAIETYLGCPNDRPSRLKRRILQSNGIRQRHYALAQPQPGDRQGTPTHTVAQLAAIAVRAALERRGSNPRDADLLACATTWPDLLVPGFASTVHGELPELPPLEAVSTLGVCCAGVAALNYAAAQVKLGTRRSAIAVASEIPSRLFLAEKFEAEPAIAAGGTLPFDVEFLRWMLSDGAAALVVEPRPAARGLSLRLDWVESVSHANAYPTCMYAGSRNPDGTGNGDSKADPASWLHYPSYGAAAAAGALNLRQNVRLLDRVVQLGVEGWLRLVEAGRVRPAEVDWFLCHYSSHFFRGRILELLEKYGCAIPEEKWFTNLYDRGNTGCASFFLMVEELLNSGKLQPGQKVFGFVPESGRFTTAYLMMTVVEGDDGEIASLRPSIAGRVAGEGDRAAPNRIEPDRPESNSAESSSSKSNFPRSNFPEANSPESSFPAFDRPESNFPESNFPESNSPESNFPETHSPKSNSPETYFPETHSPEPDRPESPADRDAEAPGAIAANLQRRLALVWLEFERDLQTVPLIRKLNRGEFTLEDYKALLRNLRPQVVEGARWIARAASNATEFSLRSMLLGHAREEHRDFQMLDRDYASVGGDPAEIARAEKNIGSEALSAFIFHQASRENPIDLLGSIFIVEGLGNRLAGRWAAQIARTLHLKPQQISFLAYHADNDEAHVAKLDTLLAADWMTPALADRVVKTARVTARLYRLQLEEIAP